ncbi:MAG TPA: fasciclin domain-containing protein [Aequorivita sp.]|nr:fasciclin domain-containing protein [Aequorivita sp.]
MKLKTILLTTAVMGMLFISCNDANKKDAEAQAQADELRMQREQDSIMSLEEASNARMADMEANSVAAKAMADANLSNFTNLLQTADLAPTFKGEGEYTVFAPTNDAFGKLPKGTLDDLMKPENKEKLQSLLKYHVLQGNMNSADVVAKIKEAGGKLDVTTLNGGILTLSEKDGKVSIKDAKGNVATVTGADLTASNGVVHTVDKVLMPK